MFFAFIGFYREGAEDRLLEISSAVNEYLGQTLLPPRLASVLRGKDGRRIGNLMIVDAPDFESAEARLNASPALHAGLYERSEVAQLSVEIGEI